MSSAYCALILGNRTFPNLLFYQTLLFRLHLTKYVNNLVIHPRKIWKNWSWFFVAILRVFDLECNGQTSVKVELIMFGLVFMKLRKLRSLFRENEKLDPRKTLMFSLFKSFPILWTSSVRQKLFSKNWSRNYLKFCNTLF